MGLQKLFIKQAQIRRTVTCVMIAPFSGEFETRTSDPIAYGIKLQNESKITASRLIHVIVTMYCGFL